MILRNRSLPHPVLSPTRDDVMPNRCECAVNVTFDADNYYLRIALDYDNQGIDTLVGDGRAVHAYKIECRRNFYRRLVRSGRGEIRLTVPVGELLGRVEVTPLVVATAEITVYEATGAHQDYGAATFALSPGDILAAAHQQSFDAYTDYDPLKKVSSFLVIQESDTLEDGPMDLDTSGDRIVATLSKGDFKRYADLRADSTIVPLLANQVVVPALVQALVEMAADQTEEQRDEAKARSRWYRSVAKRLEELKIDLQQGTHTPLYAAQVLLGEPLRRSLATLFNATAEEED